MDSIKGYELLAPFSNAGAGNCTWTFARKGGRTYFIKCFTHIKYPPENNKMSPALAEKKREHARQFYEFQSNVYSRLSICHSGNNVIPVDFFREGSSYYSVSEKVDSAFTEPRKISILPGEKKLSFIKALLHSVDIFHRANVVHCDLKPDNILIKSCGDGYYSPKIIDFEGGFVEGCMPEIISGDQVYISPEAMDAMDGEEAEITVASDLFALGILIHQYWTGSLPDIYMPDGSECMYAAEALKLGGSLVLSSRLEGELRRIVDSMLNPFPSYRMSAGEALYLLRSAERVTPVPRPTPRPEPEPITDPPPGPPRGGGGTGDGPIFYPPDDLG